MLSSLDEELRGPLRVLSLLEEVAVIGGLCHVERALFAALGCRAAEQPPHAALWATGASLKAAWRADELGVLLPVSMGLPSAEVCVRSPGPACDEAVAGLGSGSDLSGAVEGIYDALGGAYATRLSHLSAAAGGPVAVVLTRVAADLGAERDLLRCLAEGPGRNA